MSRPQLNRAQEGRYPALVAILNRRREVFGLCDRELAERTASRFGASKNVSQIHRILHLDSGTRQAYAEQLASVVDVGRHVARLLIEFEDELLPLRVPEAPPTLRECGEVLQAYERDEDMYALQGAMRLYEQSMGRSDPESLRVRAEMSLLIGKLVRSHGKYPGFIDDALRFVDDSVDLLIEIGDLDGACDAGNDLDAAQVAAEIERATIYRRRGHLDSALRVLEDCRSRFGAILATDARLDGKCWHGFGDLHEQKAVMAGDRGERHALAARNAYLAALAAYARLDDDRCRVDRHSVITDLAALDLRGGDSAAAVARLDALEAEGALAPTALARCDNRRAWAALAVGDEVGAQRMAKRAAASATASGDALLMAMAEALREATYRKLGMKQKAEVQQEALLEWVFRDGVRHAEVLRPIVARVRAERAASPEGKVPDWALRLGWLLRASWLQALLAVLAIGVAGCEAASPSAGDEAGGLHEWDVVAGELRDTAGAPARGNTPNAGQTDWRHVTIKPHTLDKVSDPKSDPKHPAAHQHQAAATSDPKAPAETCGSSDPKAPAASDPKAPADEMGCAA